MAVLYILRMDCASKFMHGVETGKWILQSMFHLFEALLGSLPLLMVTDGLGGAGDAAGESCPLPGTRPFGLPGAPKLVSRATGAALLLEYTGPVPFPV